MAATSLEIHLGFTKMKCNTLINSVKACVALGYRLDDWDSKVRFPAGAGNFSLHHRVQNGSRAHPVPYTMGTRGSFLGGKAVGA
jgi:hypothetical protein